MGLRNTASCYGICYRTLHWSTVILVISAFLLSKGDPYSLYSGGADAIRRIHETLGVLVLIVIVLQLLWRALNTMPTEQPVSRRMALSAKFVRIGLYAHLIAIPLTAVLGTWLLGLPLTLLGVDIAPQIAEAHRLGQLMINLHTTLGETILWLSGGHATAALFHHLYLRDNVLKSMTWGK